MPTILWIVCVGIVIIGGILVFQKNEDALLNFFLFSIVVCIGIFFSNLISMYK